MSQNWFSGQAGYAQQQWGQQQQVPVGWAQGGPGAGGQWVGQPHPQHHPGYYGGQQQMMAMGYPQGFPPGPQGVPPQPYHPQPHPRPHPQPQSQPHPQPQAPPHLQQSRQQFPQQPFHQQQQQQQQQQKVFQSQQAYAQQREKEAREEQKRQELKLQKQKLQSIDFSKPKVNLDDLFEKQIPEVQKPPPREMSSSPVSAHLTASPSSVAATSSAGSDTSLSTSGGVGQGREEGGRSRDEGTTSEPKPNTAETYQKLMAESLQSIKDTAPKRKAQFSTAFKRPAKKETSLQTQSKKARSWDSASDEFAGVFTQHPQPNPPSSELDDAFGDFQSSHETTRSEFVSAASTVPGQTGLPTQTLPTTHHPQPMANVLLAQSGQTGPAPYSNPQQYPVSSAGQTSAVQFPGQGVAYNQHSGNMIATSAYGGPLSSSTVVTGMQGQSPNAPQAQRMFHGPPLSPTAAVSSHQPSSFSMSVPSPLPPQNHSQLPPHIQQQVDSTRPMAPQSAGNIGPPAPETHAPSPPRVEPPQFHPVYYKVYRRCTKPGQDVVSTDILYPVLLSSKLSRVQLRNLWSIANRGTPGRLTQMELFVLLGLVALAQAGNPSPTLEDLKRAPSNPVPTLPALSSLPPQPSEQERQGDDFGEFHTPPMATPPVNPPMTMPPVNPPMATPPLNPPSIPLQPMRLEVQPPLQPTTATPHPPPAPVLPTASLTPAGLLLPRPPAASSSHAAAAAGSQPPALLPPASVSVPKLDMPAPIKPNTPQPAATGIAQPDLQAKPVLQGSLLDTDEATSTGGDKYAAFRMLQPKATATLHPEPSASTAKPDLQVQPVVQPSLLDTNVTTSNSGDKYAAFHDLQALQPEATAAPQPQSSEDKYSAFRTLDISSNASSETSSLSGDKYSALDVLRQSGGSPSLSNSSLPQPLPPQPSPQLLMPQPVTHGQPSPPHLSPSPPLLPHSQTPPLAQPPQPTASSLPPLQPRVLTPETTSAPPKTTATRDPQCVYVPSRFSPPPLPPEEPLFDQKGTKSGQQSQHPPTSGSVAMTTQKGATADHHDDGFGEFAQFPLPGSSQTPQPALLPTLGLSFPPPTVGVASSGPTPIPLPTASSSALGVSLHISADVFGGHTSKEDNQQSGGEGWANFTQFGTAPTTQTLQVSEPAPSLLPVGQASPLVAAAFGGSGDLGLLTAPTANRTQPETKDSSPLRRGGFEFRPIGSKESAQSTPTIDDLEREFLSKLSTTEATRGGGKEEFGDFEDHSKTKSFDQPVDKGKATSALKPARPQVSASEQWRMCLDKCEEVLGVCVEVLGEAEEESLLLEIVQSEEAKNKLHGIAEVYRFAKRIYCTLRSKDPSSAASVGEGVREKWEELNRLLPGNTLNKIYSAHAPGSSTDDKPTDVLSDTVSHCALCLMTKMVTIPSSFSLDGEEEEYKLSMLFHNGQTYHAPCANFWSNVVLEELPVLD